MLDSKFKKYDLNHKVDNFIDKYEKALKKVHVYTDIGNYHIPKYLKNFIESKAVYSELRWPSVYYSHWRETEKQRTEEAQKIFTWDIFKNLSVYGDFRRDLMDSDINQHVLYRIIERGGNRSGPRRGVLFTEDFGLDLNIPVSYAIDWSDPCLYEFLEPLIPQLNPETICPVNYFSRSSPNLKNVDEVKLGKIISKLSEMEDKRKIQSAAL